jgi:TPR repeat protein
MRRLIFLLLLPGSLLAQAPALKKTGTKAAAGNTEAEFLLAKAYAKGEGVPADLAKAAELYRPAAEQGHARAQHNLGSLYLAGRGVPRDEAKAAMWYRKAAGQGAALSQDALATLLVQGRGVKKDCREAVRWYSHGMALGLPNADIASLEHLHAGRLGNKEPLIREHFRVVCRQRQFNCEGAPFRSFRVYRNVEGTFEAPPSYNTFHFYPPAYIACDSI